MDEVGRAVGAVLEGRGIVVVGEPGSGRSWVVGRVLEGVDAKTRAGLWVGEDVHRLEASRAEALARAVRAGRVRPVLTASVRATIPHAIERLLRDGLLDRIDVPPPTPETVLAAVQEWLGGALDPEAVPVFVPRRPGGDLVALREVVQRAQAAGVLVHRRTGWRLEAELPPSDAVRALVHTRLGIASQPTGVELTETVLDLVALAPGIGITALDGALRAAELSTKALLGVVERLEDDGVLDVHETPQALRLRLHDGVLELILPTTLNALRRRRLTTAIVDVLDALPSDSLGGGELVALARYSLTLGRTADAGILTAAARSALQAARPELALELAQRAVERGAGPPAGLAAATAETQLRRFDEAAGRLAELASTLTPDAGERGAVIELSRLVAARGVDAGFGWNEPAASWARQAGPDLPALLHIDVQPGSTAGHASVSPRHRPGAVMSPASGGDDITVAVLEGERLAQAAGQAALTGELTRMRALLDEADAVLGEAGADSFRVQLSRAILDCFEGRIDESLTRVMGYRADAAAAGRPVQYSASSWFAGGLLLAAGRAREAAEVLRECVDLAERNGAGEAARLAWGDLAVALAVIGDETGVRAALDAFRTHRGGPLLDGRAKQAEGWMHAAAGRTAQATIAFIEAAETHESLGHSLQALLALVEAARAGGALQVEARVAELAERVEGRSLAVSANYALALARSDRRARDRGPGEAVERADELEMIAHDAAESGMHMMSAEAFDRAAALHAEAGDSRRSAAAARLSAEQAGVCGFAPLPLLLRRGAAPDRTLSARELEIARLAAGGRSNREIAEALVLSVRTVETHLQRVYRKLGVRTRGQLAGVRLPDHPHGVGSGHG
ncbi:LuxR C-terminal-related transcriptional regulator [Herbiconiux sp. A18JL235]|uniref:LuxR C-terminal-related transcriptional regulator n=1 Tax=Herbiconiux sp. A18JL235 TaxID=3152363 RepID=A0AB39BLL3_9MICO